MYQLTNTITGERIATCQDLAGLIKFTELAIDMAKLHKLTFVPYLSLHKPSGEHVLGLGYWKGAVR
jgi:hypothetical protein